MKTHKIKAWPQFFKELKSGNKTFELRKNDRDYKIGDRLLIEEWDPETKEHTGEIVVRIVTYVLSHSEFVNISDGFVILGIKAPDKWFFKVAFVGEGVVKEASFNTKEEADACAKGFELGKDLCEEFGGDNPFEDHISSVDQYELTDEE